jgi:predicted dehydrogenase
VPRSTLRDTGRDLGNRGSVLAFEKAREPGGLFRDIGGHALPTVRHHVNLPTTECLRVIARLVRSLARNGVKDQFFEQYRAAIGTDISSIVA